MKTCAKCKVKKKNSEFHKRKATKSGLVSTCKECKTLIGKVYYHENRFMISDKYRNKYHQQVLARKVGTDLKRKPKARA